MRAGPVIVVSLLVSVAGATGTFFALRSVVGGPATRALVEVPSISGMGLDHARQLLDAKQLRVVVMERRPDKLLPADKVIKQFPLAGSNLPADQVVFVTISSGRLTVAAAASPATRATPAHASGVSSSVAPGAPPTTLTSAAVPAAAVAPKPAVAASAVPPAAVAELVAVPRVLGKRVSRAAKLLLKAGLKVGRRRIKVDEDRAPDLILKQRPRPGKKVPVGTAVNLWVNSD